MGELRRFAQKFGVDALIDRESKRFLDLGLATARYSDERWLEKLVIEPLILRAPLIRCRERLTIGIDEAAWKTWIEAPS